MTTAAGIDGCPQGWVAVVLAAGAWSAMRIACGTAIPLPDPPQRLGDGFLAAIWR